MSDLSLFLFEMTDEAKRLLALGIGAFILAGLVMFHGAGLRRILLHHKRIEARATKRLPHEVGQSLLVGWSVLLMLFLHIVGISVWSLALYALGLVHGFHNAITFCANAYTTLGQGDVVLEKQWQNLGPIIAICGMFCFAWTTATLVALASTTPQRPS